ncbi:transglycosylase SLT domain-containing protein [Litorilinea aerophila]|uniref:Tetratricopeptide repeat protein n=1 Tax=Litorilinea aerophila TaxID=1204385 RepID=A0A540VDT3_9CHLR|nr:transglycosylase SLT domain-containing protein [Litorilinea aerophila]MCC9077410.1 transglycosylase SLT domain-containing protein [Litorilinea aerophila]
MMNFYNRLSRSERLVLWASVATVAVVLVLTGLHITGIFPRPMATPAASMPPSPNAPDQGRQGTLMPTFTPTAVLSTAVAAAAATSTASPVATQAATAAIPVEPPAEPTPTPAPSSPPTPTPTPASPAERLAESLRLHRYGDYAAARAQLSSLAAEITGTIRLQARYHLSKAYLAEGYYQEALAALDQLDQEFELALASQASAGVAGQEDLRHKAEYLRAQAYQGLGDNPQAIAAYQRFLDAYPDAVEWIASDLARAYLAVGNLAEAVATYRGAADTAARRGDVVHQVGLLESLAAVYSGQARHQEAAAVYGDILAVARNAPYRAQIQYQAGLALANAGDEAGAIQAWQAATQEAPASRYAYYALVELVNRQVDFDLYLRGYIDLQASLLGENAWLPAVNAFQAYLEQAGPDGDRADLAWLGLGQAYLGLGNYDAAIQALDHLLANYPACSCYGQAWLDKARAQAAAGDRVEARRTYRTFAREHADHELAPEALWRSGLLALEEGNRLEAAVDFLALADGFPDSSRAPAGLYAIGLGAYQEGLYAESVAMFQRLQRDYPEYRWDAVAFWLGRAHQAAGSQAEAHAAWQTLHERAPDIYYGILAGASLAQIPLAGGALLDNMDHIAGPASTLPGDDGSQAFAEAWLARWLGVEPASLSSLPEEAAQDPDLALGRVLLDLDERAAALSALERFYNRHRDDPHALYAMSLTFEALGTYRLSLMAMARLLEFSPARLVEDAPIFLQRRAYPQPFRELIAPEAQANGLDPLLLYSLIRQESLFEEGAISVAAAQGLAQIIPDTGHWIATQLGFPNYRNELVYRPHINVKFGAYYLRWVQDYLQGNPISALVGYNAGPSRSARWREASGADDALFVEMLTLSEPRVYVQAVVANLYHYTRLYGAQGMAAAPGP